MPSSTMRAPRRPAIARLLQPALAPRRRTLEGRQELLLTGVSGGHWDWLKWGAVGDARWDWLLFPSVDRIG